MYKFMLISKETKLNRTITKDKDMEENIKMDRIEDSMKEDINREEIKEDNKKE